MPDTPPASPARIAATLAALLARHGLTRIYTAAGSVLAVISVADGLTAWTNGYPACVPYSSWRRSHISGGSPSLRPDGARSRKP
jgi:hypothetical protein